MQSNEIREKFIKFFEKRGHIRIPSAPLVPENDPSVLFVTAGMQPLVPYLLGAEHPQGTRLVNVQKCVRTQDIEEVGDATHDTFFEMLGNWSLGDYFKKEAIEYSFQLLTDPIEGFALDPKRLYVTCFEGDSDAPRDEESAHIWETLGVPRERIYFLGKKDNWWSPGENGPCGPDTEMFYDVTPNGLGKMTKDEFIAADNKQDVIEIWNDVFMEYEKRNGRVVGRLQKKNVDTGAGLERLAMVLQKKDNIFETDLFLPLMKEARNLSSILRIQRIIADHVRTACFIIADGVVPSNREQGYILRRLIRRSVFYARESRDQRSIFEKIIAATVSVYAKTYPEIAENKDKITAIFNDEAKKFLLTLEKGMRLFEKLTRQGRLSGRDLFNLFTTYGFPVELSVELASQHGIHVDKEGYQYEMKKHQELSRQGAEKKFKGGLADNNPNTIKLHTATHLLHAALRKVLGTHVQQKGSNITSERLRFDFSHGAKLTEEQVKKVEGLVNEWITSDLLMKREVLPVNKAKEKGAIGLFDDVYARVGDKVSVYSATDPKSGTIVSMEVCGGPHVKRTGELGRFKIIKEESAAAGVRRIKAVLT